MKPYWQSDSVTIYHGKVGRDGVRVPVSRARARGLMVEVYGPLYEEWENAA